MTTRKGRPRRRPLPDQTTSPAVIGRLIRDARQASGLSINYVANAIGVSPAMVQRYESGDCEPKLGVGLRIAALVGVNITKLIGDVYHAQSNSAKMRN